MAQTCQRLDCFCLGELTSLDLSRTAASEATLAQLATAKKLRVLNLKGCRSLTAASLSGVAGVCLAPPLHCPL